MDSDQKPQQVRPDEWGLFDPEEAGLAAVLKRLSAARRASPLRDDTSGRGGHEPPPPSVADRR